MQCLTQQTITGCTNAECTTQSQVIAYTVVSPQPTQYTTCTNILAEPKDVAINTWALTAEQGLQLATAIAICWGTAYAFAQIGTFLNSRFSNQSEE